MKLIELVNNVRSKNAGPFWVIASIYQQPEDRIKRFELPELHVLKFSFPRPVIQGSRYDRDMHGAQYSVLLAELELPD